MNKNDEIEGDQLNRFFGAVRFKTFFKLSTIVNSYNNPDNRNGSVR